MSFDAPLCFLAAGYSPAHEPHVGTALVADTSLAFSVVASNGVRFGVTARFWASSPLAHDLTPVLACRLLTEQGARLGIGAAGDYITEYGESLIADDPRFRWPEVCSKALEALFGRTSAPCRFAANCPGGRPCAAGLPRPTDPSGS